MANDLSGIRREAAMVFHEKIAKKQQKWEPAVEIITGGESTLSLGMQMSAGIFDAAHATNDLSAGDINSVKTTLGSEYFEKKVRVRWQDAVQNPGAIVRAAESLAGAAMASVDKIVTTGLAGAFTVNHPAQSLVNPSGGTAKKMIDGGLAIGGGSDLQYNLIGTSVSGAGVHTAGTVSLSQGSLSTALSVMGAYKSHENISLGLSGPYALVYGPSNASIAYQLLNSAVISSDLQASRINALDVVGCELAEMGNDWLLVDRTAKPFVLRYHYAPEVFISRTTDGTWIEAVSKFGCKFGYLPSEVGVVGSNPP